MKKISILSLVAVLAATPMMANAAITPITKKTFEANSNVASTSYVKGAYNDLADHINSNVAAINLLNGDASQEGSVAHAIAAVNSAADSLTSRVADNEDAIELLNAGSSTAGSVDYKINTQAASASYTNNSMDGIATISGAIGNLDSRLDSAESSITTLTAGASTEGSVDYKIAAAIDEVNTAADSLTSRVADNEDAIELLNAGASTAGSVDYKIAAAIDEVNTAADSLTSRVADNEDAIELLNAGSSTEGSVAYAVAQEADARATAVTNAISTASADATEKANNAEAAAKAYADSKFLTVNTTWDSDSTTSTIHLSNPGA